MTELAIRHIQPLTEKVEYARFLAESGLLPASYRKQPANILFAYEYGELLGLHPIAAITGIHVIEGKPAIGASLISALVRRAGHKLRVQDNGEAARCQIIRADDPGFTYAATWDMERAKTAGLLGRTNWQRYPAAMRKARAISECARDACPEVLLGLHYTPDELGAEDDGGEIIHDGWPTTGNGMVDAGQLSEDERENARLMNLRQRTEHAELRDMNKIDPADVTVDRPDSPPDDDPWAEPGRPPKRASQAALKKLDTLLRSLDLGPAADIVTVVEWVTGNTPYTATASQVADLTKWLGSHVEACGGDVDKARDAIWEQYRAVHPEEDNVTP
jgi:hypothetical protein